MNTLHIGTKIDGTPFELPADLGDKKIAVLAQSKKGKTYGLGCLLEELVKAKRPFIATDPASNLWGLRVLPDGRPSGLQVVVIGGPHADIPFDKDAGERMADLLLSTPICAVIDLGYEDPAHVRKFMTSFAKRLMQSKPEIARVIVLEEAPELIPQNAFGIQAQICKAAVAKLAIVGGNYNYGVVPACQRPATMDKNVLSQCEGLIVMGITHKKDRTTIKEWMEAKDIDDQVASAFNELGSLKPGEAWYWNPGEERFERFTFRKRETLHPREMQKLGLKAGALQLGDMDAFVQKARQALTKTTVAVPGPKQIVIAEGKQAKAILKAAEHPLAEEAVQHYIRECEKMAKTITDLKAENAQLRDELGSAKGVMANAHHVIDTIRKHLQPQYDLFHKLFGAIGEASTPADTGAIGEASTPADTGAIGEAWALWLEKAPSDNYRKVLNVLIKHGRLKKRELATRSGVQFNGGTWVRIHAWLTRNSLAVSEGDEIVAAKL